VKKTRLKRIVLCCLLLAVSCWCTGCSHLHVDFDSTWADRAINVVAIEQHDAPTGVTNTAIAQILTEAGWQVVESAAQAEAIVVCKWARVTDLNAESEPVLAVKSFHVQIVSVHQPKVLAVADYFYPQGGNKLLPGVKIALLAIQRGSSVVPAQPAEITTKNNLAADKAVIAKTAIVAVNPVADNTPAPPVAAKEPLKSIETVPAKEPTLTIETVTATPMNIEPLIPAEQKVAPLESAAPVNMEKSPWIPRFQGLGLEAWGKE
jgi:hypothetical protein